MIWIINKVTNSNYHNLCSNSFGIKTFIDELKAFRAIDLTFDGIITLTIDEKALHSILSRFEFGENSTFLRFWHFSKALLQISVTVDGIIILSIDVDVNAYLSIILSLEAGRNSTI